MSLAIESLLHCALARDSGGTDGLVFGSVIGITRASDFVTALVPHSDFRVTCARRRVSTSRGGTCSGCASPLNTTVLVGHLFARNLVSSRGRDFVGGALGRYGANMSEVTTPLLSGRKIIVTRGANSNGIGRGNILTTRGSITCVYLPGGVDCALTMFIGSFGKGRSRTSRCITRVSTMMCSLLVRASMGSWATLTLVVGSGRSGDALVIVKILLSCWSGYFCCGLGPLLFLSSYYNALTPCLDLYRYSLGRSTVNFLFVIEFDLLSSSKSFSALGVSSFVSGFHLYYSR